MGPVTLPTPILALYTDTCQLLWIVQVFTPFTEYRSGTVETLTSPDSKEAVRDYYGVQHDTKELRMGPKRID